MLREIDIKRSLYKNNDFMLSDDSLNNGEVINTEFQTLIILYLKLNLLFINIELNSTTQNFIQFKAVLTLPYYIILFIDKSTAKT